MNSKKIYELFIKEKDTHICIDSRSPNIKNSIFFGIKGERFNGTSFAKMAIDNGAKIAIVDTSNKLDHSVIVVPNPLKILQEIAQIHRSTFNIPVIAITGSNGKTTTKNILTQILSGLFKTSSTKGNFNNHIGVPLTILSLKEHHEIAIVEMGANHIEEIKYLCKIAQPTHGMITNIGSAHIEGFGSLKNIKNAKNELFDFLKINNGTIIYNSKDQTLIDLIKNYKKTIPYKAPNFINEHKEIKDNTDFNYSCKPFIVINPMNPTSKITTHIIGKYNINNIIAAMKIAEVMKVPFDVIRNQLQSIKLKNNRSELIKTKRNHILLDAYNANPTSMAKAIKDFLEIKDFLTYKTPLLILGDMLELGVDALYYHQKIVKLIEKNNIKNCILIGEIFCQTKCNYIKIYNTNNISKVMSLKNIGQKSILIKGSRKLKLETMVPFL